MAGIGTSSNPGTFYGDRMCVDLKNLKEYQSSGRLGVLPPIAGTVLVIVLLGWILRGLPTAIDQEFGIVPTTEVAPVQVVVETEEVWRLGDNENEEFMFGVIEKVLSDEAGNFYLLDTQLNEVFKFSPDGHYLKSITRQGEGPGEINLCYFCNFWTKSAMACINIFPKGFIRFDLEGIPLSNLKATPLPDLGSEETISIFKFTRREGITVGDGRHYFYENGETSQIHFLSSFDEEMNEVHRYSETPTGYNFKKPITIDEDADYIPYSSWALGPEGEVFLAPNRTGFLIEVRDSQGNLKREIHRDWHPAKRTKEEKAEAKNQWSFSTNGMNMPKISYKISDYPTTNWAMNWIDGNLWVTTSRTRKMSQNAGIYVIDIFNQKGHLLEERTHLLPYDSDKDQLHWLDGGRVIVVKNIKSARLAAQDSDMQVQVGDSINKSVDEEDSILEVILYQVKN